MTFFFLVVGLEAKRELDIGALRERRRLALPCWRRARRHDRAGADLPRLQRRRFGRARVGGGDVDRHRVRARRARAGGAARDAPADPPAHAGGVRRPRGARRDRRGRTRSGSSSSRCCSPPGSSALLVALRFAPSAWRGVCGGGARRGGVGRAATSRASIRSIAGLAVGLVTSAYPPARTDLERATELTRSFREQPTPQLARSAQRSVASAISANERLQYRLHPWTSYVIVPLFALANAGIHVDGELLGDALTSPITLGIVVGYVVGKPVGIVAATWIVARLGGPPRTLSWPVIAGGGNRRRHRLHRGAADREHRVRRAAARRGEARRDRRRARWRRW